MRRAPPMLSCSVAMREMHDSQTMSPLWPLICFITSETPATHMHMHMHITAHTSGWEKAFPIYKK